MKHIYHSVLYFIFVFSLVFARLSTANDDKVINIATPAWKHWTNADGTGFYFDLTRIIYEPLGYKISYSIVPFARAKMFVQSNKVDAMYSLYRSIRYNILTPNYPIDASNVMVMFNNQIKWNGISSLEGQNVIYPRSYEYPAEMSVSVLPIEVNDSKHGMLMLLKGRAPFFMTDSDEMAQLQQELNVNVMTYSTKHLYSKNLYMAFAKTDKGQTLVNIFDQRMPELILNGTIEQLYLKWGLPQKVNLDTMIQPCIP